MMPLLYLNFGILDGVLALVELLLEGQAGDPVGTVGHQQHGELELSNILACSINIRCKLIPTKQQKCRVTMGKVYKYKAVSTRFNNDIYGIENIYLEERLPVLVNIHAQLGLVVLPPAHNYYIVVGLLLRPLDLDVCCYISLHKIPVLAR
jgi:hypothetical protein